MCLSVTVTFVAKRLIKRIELILGMRVTTENIHCIRLDPGSLFVTGKGTFMLVECYVKKFSALATPRSAIPTIASLQLSVVSFSFNVDFQFKHESV